MPRAPQKRFIPGDIIVQLVPMRFVGDNFVGRAPNEPVTFTGHDAHERAAAFLATYPKLLADATADLNRSPE